MRRVKRSVMSMNITNDPLSGAEIAARGPGDYHLQCVVAMMSYENVITRLSWDAAGFAKTLLRFLHRVSEQCRVENSIANCTTCSESTFSTPGDVIIPYKLRW